MSVPEWVGLVTSCITALGVLLAVPQIVELNRQQHRSFEQLYVQRYWQLQDGYSVDFQLGRRNTPLADKDAATARAYLQLCEDELDMFKAGRVTRSTWQNWRSGMEPALQSEPFHSIISESPASEWPSIREFLKTGSPGDPYAAVWMRVRGLG